MWADYWKMEYYYARITYWNVNIKFTGAKTQEIWILSIFRIDFAMGLLRPLLGFAGPISPYSRHDPSAWVLG